MLTKSQITALFYLALLISQYISLSVYFKSQDSHNDMCKNHQAERKFCSKLFTQMPYPCSHFYFDIKFGHRLYSKEKRRAWPISRIFFCLLLWHSVFTRGLTTPKFIKRGTNLTTQAVHGMFEACLWFWHEVSTYYILLLVVHLFSAISHRQFVSKKEPNRKFTVICIRKSHLALGN